MTRLAGLCLALAACDASRDPSTSVASSALDDLDLYYDYLAGDPCLTAEQQARAEAAFDAWSDRFPSPNPYVTHTLLYIAPLQVADDEVVIAVAITDFDGLNRTTERQVLWLDDEGTERRRVVGRALRSYPDGDLLIDLGATRHWDCDGCTYDYDQRSELGWFVDGERVAYTRLAGRVTPDEVWPVGRDDQYLMASRAGQQQNLRGERYRRGGAPFALAECGRDLVELHSWAPLAEPAPDGPVAAAIVRYANTVEDATYEARAMMDYRRGPDGRDFTADDNLFESTEEVRRSGRISVPAMAYDLATNQTLVNPCTSAEDEARALAMYRAWRPSAFPPWDRRVRTYVRLLGVLAVSADGAALAIHVREDSFRTQHRPYIIWIDASGRELRREPGRAWHLLPGGGAIIGMGTPSFDSERPCSSCDNERTVLQTVGRADARGLAWSRNLWWGKAQRSEIWLTRGGDGLLFLERPAPYGVPADYGRSSLVDVATGAYRRREEPACGATW